MSKSRNRSPSTGGLVVCFPDRWCDIGKIGTRDEVLLKDGKLTDEEFEVIKKHPVIGESILQKIQPDFTMLPLLPGVRSHHERYDGKGYPDGVRGEQIPLFGSILAVADACDAMHLKPLTWKTSRQL